MQRSRTTQRRLSLNGRTSERRWPATDGMSAATHQRHRNRLQPDQRARCQRPARTRRAFSAANSRSATRSSRARLPRALLYLGSPILCLGRLIKTHGSYAKRDWGISEPSAHSRHFSRGTRGVAAVRITRQYARVEENRSQWKNTRKCWTRQTWWTAFPFG